jgi:hypothetical protein
MFRYHARLFDAYRRQIVSFAILGDDRPRWRPTAFGYARWGCTLNLTFPIAKLLDHDPADLEDDPNPCATIVLAHLNAQATRHDPEGRARAKLAMFRRFFRLGYDRERIVRLFRFIEWLLRLPKELEEQTWRGILAIEEERNVTYVTYGERIGLERGLRQGIVTGLNLRFGDDGRALIPAVEQTSDPAILQAILERVMTATSADEVRAVYAPGEGSDE